MYASSQLKYGLKSPLHQISTSFKYFFLYTKLFMFAETTILLIYIFDKTMKFQACPHKKEITDRISLSESK